MEKNLLPHQQRVVDEQTELSTKMLNLFTFMKTNTFNELEYMDKQLLSAQYTAMEAHSRILGLRIDRF
jgi:hypothetical protein